MRKKYKLFSRKPKPKKKRVFVFGGDNIRFDDMIKRVSTIDNAQEVWIYDRNLKLNENILNICKDRNINIKYKDLSITTNATKNAISDYCLQHQKNHIKSREKTFEMENEL